MKYKISICRTYKLKMKVMQGTFTKEELNNKVQHAINSLEKDEDVDKIIIEKVKEE